MSLALASLAWADFLDLILGAMLAAIGIYLAARPQDFASGLYSWYHGIPEGKWGPKWFRWQFRPTASQSVIVARIGAVVILIVGVQFIVRGAFGLVR